MRSSRRGSAWSYHGTVTRLLKILEATGLAPLAFSFYERWEARGLQTEPGSAVIPPPRLRFKVAGTADPEHFLDGGLKAAESLRAVLAEQGTSLAALQAPILEFGCGCGRVLLHLKDASDLHGCDYNSELVQWCGANLPSARVVRNGLEPPLPFGAGEFRLVYALSVFTHFPVDLARRWMAELERVLAPGGLLAFSTHGEHYLPSLDEKERSKFLAGEAVVRFPRSAGANLCNAYHPRAFVERSLAAKLELLSFQPKGARGNPHQDLYLFRKAQ